MIKLKKVNEENFREVINIKMPPEQGFVASNVYSLAQAWIYYDEARPFAVCNDDEVIGFMMLGYDVDNKEAEIWRFMIAQEKQEKGYGQEAIKCAIEMIKNEGLFNCIYLDYVPGNVVAKHVYEKFGFVETGEIEDGEIVMKLEL